jgi:hypothetical protein
MRDSAFQYWRNERDAVEQEMDRLITAGSPASVEERQVRRIRFAALIERREAAACNLLRSDRALRGHKSSVARSRAGDWPSSVDYLSFDTAAIHPDAAAVPPDSVALALELGASSALPSEAAAIHPHAGALPPDGVCRTMVCSISSRDLKAID